MAEIKPIGIDQTTGQQRPVASDDTVDLGNEIEIAVKNVGDYSGGTNQVTVLYPWDDQMLLDTPNTVPTGIPLEMDWSPDGEYLAIAHITSPYIGVYQRSGTSFNRLPNLPSGPTGTARSVEFSPDGEFLAVGSGQNTGGEITIRFYQRDGNDFSKLADPSTLPNDFFVAGVSWSPNGELVACTDRTVSPFFKIYKREGTTFTDTLTVPASLPSSSPSALSWSPNGQFLALLGNNTPKLNIYEYDGVNLTLLAAPASSPTVSTGQAISWSPDSQFLAVPTTQAGAPFYVFQRSGTTFTKLDDPASADATSARTLDWSPNGKYLAIGHGSGIGGGEYSVYERNGTTMTRLADPASLPFTGSQCDALAWSPDQQFLIISNDNASFRFVPYQTSGTMPASGVVKIIGQPLAGA